MRGGRGWGIVREMAPGDIKNCLFCVLICGCKSIIGSSNRDDPAFKELNIENERDRFLLEGEKRYPFAEV